MKNCLLFVLLFPLILNAQKSKISNANPDVLAGKTYEFKVSKIAPKEIKLPFSSILIIDNRFDTSKLGFIPVELQIIPDKRKVGRKILFKDGVSKAIEKYYNEYYQNSFSKNETQLVIVLKKFWLTGVNNRNNKAIDVSKTTKAASYLYCKWEYYIHNGEKYIPVKRVDTVINGVIYEGDDNDGFSSQKRKNVLKQILNGLIEVFDFTGVVNALEKYPQKTWEQVKQYNYGYFDMPILKDSIINQGVYLTFNDFKNNRPSIMNFKERTLRIAINKTENYLEDSIGNRITNFWGYYNGDDFKVGKYGNEKLFRINNTFEFFLKHQYETDSPSLIGKNNYHEIWIPYQLDMETGNIY